ncbi:MAG: hypothetical protein HDR29_07925 [Lachnospiraceae bacterium]|nr:hypothetical protein [Lachnospiraceae bacterium]
MLTEELYNLDKKENSPVIVLPWFNNCRVLIDTGSTMPMWLKSIVPLKIKGAVKQDRQIELNGIGGKTSGDLYKVNFDFGNIHFKDLPIIHKEIKVADAYMILPATLFTGMIYEINNIEHTFKVQVDNKGYYRQFKIKDNNGIPYVYLANTYETEEEYNSCTNS